MTETPAPPIDTPVTTVVLEQMLRTALHDVVTVDMMRPLVNQEVERRYEFTRTQISAIDSAQRLAFEQFNSAASRMQSTADMFQNTAQTIKESMGGLKATDAAQAQDIADIKERLEGIGVWMQSIEGRLNKTENQQVSLHADIHGSPTETNRQNVFTSLGLISAKIDDKFAAVNTRLDKMEDKLDAHDKYIARRKAFETWVLNTAKSIWKKQLARWAIITGLPILGTLFAAALDPRIADGIAKFLTLVLTGK